jgi:hypothetical protein
VQQLQTLLARRLQESMSQCGDTRGGGGEGGGGADGVAHCCLAVDREKLWESSRRALEALPPHHLLRPLRVTFVGEDGADYGGLRREWFHLVTLEMVLSLLALLLD